MLIAANKAVSIDYTLTNDAGEVIDSSAGGAPLVYLQGAGNIIPGLEKALEGKAVGDELTVAQHALYMGQAQRLRRFQAVGARHQFGGALRPGVARMGLGNRFEKADFEAGPLKCTHQPEADGGQTHTKIGGCDKKSLHADSLRVHGKGDHL